MAVFVGGPSDSIYHCPTDSPSACDPRVEERCAAKGAEDRGGHRVSGAEDWRRAGSGGSLALRRKSSHTRNRGPATRGSRIRRRGAAIRLPSSAPPNRIAVASTASISIQIRIRGRCMADSLWLWWIGRDRHPRAFTGEFVFLAHRLVPITLFLAQVLSKRVC